MSAEKVVGERIFGFRTYLSPTSAGVRIFLFPTSLSRLPRYLFVIIVA